MYFGKNQLILMESSQITRWVENMFTCPFIYFGTPIPAQYLLCDPKRTVYRQGLFTSNAFNNRCNPRGGILPMMAYTGSLHPKEASFSGIYIRYMKG